MVLESKENERSHGAAKERILKVVLVLQGILICAALYFACGNSAYAAEAANPDGIITSQFDKLLNIVLSIISSCGTIFTVWGIFEWGIAFQGQDGTAQAHAFKRIAGGLVIIVAPQLITLF